MTRCSTSYGYGFYSDGEPKETLLLAVYFVKEAKQKNKTKTTHTQKDDTITEYMSIELLYPNSELSVTEIKQTIGSN